MLLCLVALTAQAQYKVVGPDGKVTYTDIPPPPTAAKVTTLGVAGSSGGSASADASLPLELRQPAARYPVTLYTTSGACSPCSDARSNLKSRGIPYSEKQVQSAEDQDALEKLTGGRDIPTLAIGSQYLRGLAPEVWNSYLDAAGYPRVSRLPASYQYAAATPLVEKREAAPPRAPDAASAPKLGATTAPPSPGAAGIKF